VNSVLAQLRWGQVGVREVLSQNFEFAEVGGLPGPATFRASPFSQREILCEGAAAGRSCVGSSAAMGETGVGSEIELCVVVALLPI